MDDPSVMATAVPAVKIRSLNVMFDTHSVLKDISCEMPAHHITVIMGRSGSGKTTLLRAMNRLNECFDGCSTSGQVRVRLGGQWVETYGSKAPAPTELRRRIGMVFQTPNVLPMSVERNMILPLRLTGALSRQERRNRMEASLREAQLWDEVKDRLGSNALKLSGGQQQRLCLARALALEPEILLLDEPTASLDYAAAEKIEQLLLDLREKYTLVLVSHSPSQARRLADRLLVLQEGELAQTLGRDEVPESSEPESETEDRFRYARSL